LAALAAGVYGGKLFFSEPAPTPPSYRQLTFRRGSIRSARFAPDGQTILYSAAWQGTPVDVFTARPEAPEARSMGLNRTQTGVGIFGVGDGRPAEQQSIGTWVNMGTLARAPLVGGAPREVLEQVQWADWRRMAAGLPSCEISAGATVWNFPLENHSTKTGGWIGHPRVSP